MYNPMSRDFHLHRTPVDVLNYEIVEEQAAALGRMGRALEAALAKLREFDAAIRARARRRQRSRHGVPW